MSNIHFNKGNLFNETFFLQQIQNNDFKNHNKIIKI